MDAYFVVLCEESCLKFHNRTCGHVQVSQQLIKATDVTSVALCRGEKTHEYYNLCVPAVAW